MQLQPGAVEEEAAAEFGEGRPLWVEVPMPMARRTPGSTSGSSSWRPVQAGQMPALLWARGGASPARTQAPERPPPQRTRPPPSPPLHSPRWAQAAGSAPRETHAAEEAPEASRRGAFPRCPEAVGDWDR